MLHISEFAAFFEQEEKYLKYLEDAARKMINNAPKGLVRVRRRGRQLIWTVEEEGTGPGGATGNAPGGGLFEESGVKRRERYIGRSDPMYELYIRKYCAQRVMTAVLRSRRILLKDPKHYDPAEITGVLEMLDNKLGGEVPEIFATNSRLLRKWESDASNDVSPWQEKKVYRTERGELVRSKLECLCINTIYRMGIFYRYESRLQLKNGIILHPDVVMLSHVNGRMYYLEICGMITDPGYAAELCRRLKLLAENEIILGDNLLLVTECEEVPFDTRAFQDMLRNTVLKPLAPTLDPGRFSAD